MPCPHIICREFMLHHSELRNIGLDIGRLGKLPHVLVLKASEGYVACHTHAYTILMCSIYTFINANTYQLFLSHWQILKDFINYTSHQRDTDGLFQFTEKKWERGARSKKKVSGFKSLILFIGMCMCAAPELVSDAVLCLLYCFLNEVRSLTCLLGHTICQMLADTRPLDDSGAGQLGRLKHCRCQFLHNTRENLICTAIGLQWPPLKQKTTQLSILHTT